MDDDLVKPQWSMGRRVVTAILFIVVIVLAGIISFLGIEHYKNNSHQPNITQSTSKSTPRSPLDNSSATSASSTNGAPPPQTQTAQLSNSGPGDTIALFSVSVVLFGVGHYLWQRSKTKSF